MPDVEELPVPEKAYVARQKAEMARIWIVDGEQIAVISPRMWDDPGSWGVMLVDMAKHIAEAYQSKGHNPDDTLERIKSAMEAEWMHPTV
jgi:hypothetical protein